MRFDPGQQALRPQLPTEDLKHLLLQVGGDHASLIPDPLCELAGKEARAAAEVEDPVAGFHVPLGEPVGAVEEAPETGVEVGGFFIGEDVVVRFSVRHKGMLGVGYVIGLGIMRE